ncbi:hypothetical protein JHV666_34090 [Mycobacterium avium subsp. hominissuis]|nr:hypothetical protein MINTM003_01060 [Mycobacterium paraintracellulare]BCO86854.1 hypothetical protein MINTM015_01110 [Mycobacterium paraintracellulare]
MPDDGDRVQSYGCLSTGYWCGLVEHYPQRHPGVNKCLLPGHLCAKLQTIADASHPGDQQVGAKMSYQ